MRLYGLVFLFLFFVGCASPKLLSSWKSPEADTYQVYKVLVVGMTQNDAVRDAFETRLKDELVKRGFEVRRSMELFGDTFPASEKTEENLDEVEQKLLDQGFDAVLLTKIIGSENRKTLRERIGALDNLYSEFSEDYLSNQSIYFDSEENKTFRMYTTETALYCICQEKERALIWKGNLNVPEPAKLERTLDAYIKIISKAMQEENILF